MKQAVIAMLLAPLAVLAQQSDLAWTNIGPGPAAVEAIAVDPLGSGTIFIGTISGGVRKSVDGGMTWSAVNTGLTTIAMQALALDASGPQTVYAGTSGGLFKTSDGGDTWQILSAISGTVTSVTADPNRSGVVYAGAFNNLANGSIRKSIDGGMTWTTLFPTTAAIFNITIDPGNSDILYAPTIGHGAFKSTDGGNSWSPLSALTPASIWKIALDPANSQVLYAATNEDGVWKSADAGNTWQPTGLSGDFPVYSLTVDPSAPRTIYAGTNGGGVWISCDGGVAWHSTSLSNGMVFSLAADSAGVLYAGTNAAGAQASGDHGTTWSVLDAGIEDVNKFSYGVWIEPNRGRTILVSSECNGGNLFKTTDAGAHWIRGPVDAWKVVVDPLDSSVVYTLPFEGIGGNPAKSMDAGLTWSTLNPGLASSDFVLDLVIDPGDSSTLFVVTAREGVLNTVDQGATWSPASSGLPTSDVSALAISASDPLTLYAGTAVDCDDCPYAGDGAFKSIDGGASWTAIGNGLPGGAIFLVAVDPQDCATVYVGQFMADTNALFKTVDGGATWDRLNSGLDGSYAGSLAIDPHNPSVLYVATGKGVFRSTDGGENWCAANLGLPDGSVGAVVIGPKDSSTVYAAGEAGLFVVTFTP